MKRVYIFVLFLLLILPAHSAAENSSPEDMFKRSFPDISFESITPTSVKGFYEVYTGNQLFYYVPEKNVLFYGNMVSKEGKNLTRESFLKKTALRMAHLPLDSALKIGEGKNVIIEFMDPDCSHCRESYKFLSQRKDVAVYVFFYPLSQLSERKIRHILCATDRLKVYNEVMSGKFDNNAALNDCKDNKVDEIIKTHKNLAAQIGIRSTPFFYVKGKAIDGFELLVFEQLFKK